MAQDAPWCRAGHPCAGPPDRTVARGTAAPGTVALLGPDRGRRSSPGPVRGRARRGADHSRRATELVRQAMASDDAQELGLRAEDLLADPRTALVLLGGPQPWPAARQAVVQHFGRVGALMVVAYEERWAVGDARTDPDLDGLVRDFPRLDAVDLHGLLARIDGNGEAPSADPGFDAHRWLHATFAVAARDGTPAAHRAYMQALDDVMRLVRPLVAS